MLLAQWTVEAQASQKAEARQKLFLHENNTIIFRGEVATASVDKAEKDLLALVKQRGNRDYPLYLVIDSPGGGITDGEDFIQFAKMYPNVHTLSIFAASMASAIQQGMPGKRYVMSNSILMFHRAKGGVEGQFENGELESRLSLYKKIVRSMESRNAERMGVSIEQYKADVVNELWLLPSDSYGKNNSYDAVVDVMCSEGLINQTEEMQFNIMGLFTVRLKFSKCPLLKNPEVVQGEESAVNLLLQNKSIDGGMQLWYNRLK